MFFRFVAFSFLFCCLKEGHVFVAKRRCACRVLSNGSILKDRGTSRFFPFWDLLTFAFYDSKYKPLKLTLPLTLQTPDLDLTNCSLPPKIAPVRYYEKSCGFVVLCLLFLKLSSCYLVILILRVKLRVIILILVLILSGSTFSSAWSSPLSRWRILDFRASTLVASASSFRQSNLCL